MIVCAKQDWMAKTKLAAGTKKGRHVDQKKQTEKKCEPRRFTNPLEVQYLLPSMSGSNFTYPLV